MNNLPVFLVTFVPFLFFQRWLRLRLQRISVALTGSQNAALIVYWLIWLPGVIVHELAHWLTSVVLLAGVGKINLRPRVQDGYIVLGSVEHRPVDAIRGSLIGLAPLIGGSLVAYLLGYGLFHVAGGEEIFLTGDLGQMAQVIWLAVQTTQVWLWLYLIFAVANSMVPSPWDRTEWLAAILFVGFLAGLAYFAGVQDVFPSMASGLDRFIGYLAFVSALTLLVDIPFVVLVFLLDGLTGPFRK